MVCALFTRSNLDQERRAHGKLLSMKCTNDNLANPIVGFIEHMEAVLKAYVDLM